MQIQSIVRRRLTTLAAALATALAVAVPAQADINIGVILSTTGPGASSR